MNAPVRQVRHLPLAVLAAATLAAALPAFGQSVSSTSVATDPVGYNTLTLPAGNNPVVNTFVQPKAFQGVASTVSSGSTATILISGSGSILTNGSFNWTGTEPAYYLEVLSSGSAQGFIADVMSNTANTVTVDANLVAAGVSGTTSFCIRPHTTLSSLFPATTGFAAYVDTVQLYYPNGSSRVFLFTGTGTGWVDVNTFNDAGSEVVYPGEGFILSTQSSKSVAILGSVKAGPTIVPLYANVVNIVGTINPGVSGTQTLSNFNYPGTFAAYVDAAQPYSTDGKFTSQGLFISTGSNMVNVSTFNNADALQVPTATAVLVSVQQAKNWVMPSFYTSGQ